MLFRHMSYGVDVAAPPSAITLGVRTVFHAAANATTHTFAVIMPVGVNLLVVKALIFSSSSTFSAVRWDGSGGTLLTQAISITAPPGNCKSAQFYLANPATGTRNVHITLSLTGRPSLEAVGLINADTTSPVIEVTAPNSNSATSLTSGPMTPVGTSWLETCVTKSGNTEAFTPGGGVVETADVNYGNGRGAHGFIADVDALVSPSWSWATLRECAMTNVLWRAA